MEGCWPDPEPDFAPPGGVAPIQACRAIIRLTLILECVVSIGLIYPSRASRRGETSAVAVCLPRSRLRRRVGPSPLVCIRTISVFWIIMWRLLHLGI